MYYIHAISSISHQDSFRQENLYRALKQLDENSELISPDYKEFIPPAALRRLSPVLRIGLTAAVECATTIGKDFDAIVVGTALGCLKDTEKFLVTIHTTTSDVLSPTAFIQSTHNTIGGQISLGLDNHAYNMTHTQNNLSFEVSLLDAMMCIDEGKQNVLVGAADEKIEFLEKLQPDLIPNSHPLTSGASFFALSSAKSSGTIGIKSLYTSFSSKNVKSKILAFLTKVGISLSDIDLILHSDSKLSKEFEEIKNMNYLEFSGFHYSASSLALHIAHDFLLVDNNKYALIINDMCPDNLGLILVEKNDT